MFAVCILGVTRTVKFHLIMARTHLFLCTFLCFLLLFFFFFFFFLCLHDCRASRRDAATVHDGTSSVGYTAARSGLRGREIVSVLLGKFSHKQEADSPFLTGYLLCFYRHRVVTLRCDNAARGSKRVALPSRNKNVETRRRPSSSSLSSPLPPSPSPSPPLRLPFPVHSSSSVSFRRMIMHIFPRM